MTVSDHYHTPVLLHDSINGLRINPDGIYVDVTFGGGGHSREILNFLGKGKLFALDQDSDAFENRIKDEKFKLIASNFRYLKKSLRLEGVKEVDGVLADLGVSSHQFDVGQRGFSFRFEGPLDMRMNQGVGKTAESILNSYEFEELARIFRRYGEVRNPGKLAEKIISFRESERIESTFQFKKLILPLANQRKQSQYLSKVFQALRIEVNEELLALEELLLQCVDLIKPGGRLAVISYHSLEDRLIKNFLRSGNFEGQIEKDFFGKDIKPFKALSAKPIKASEKEIERNPRARSARLRIGERLNEQT